MSRSVPGFGLAGLQIRDLKRYIPEECQRQILRALTDGPFFDLLDELQEAEREYARRLVNGALAGMGGVDLSYSDGGRML